MIQSVRGRGAAVLTSLALLGTGAVVGAVPAQSVPADVECVAAFPAADLTKGDSVTGLTVLQGTEPVEFTGEYLGAVSGAIAPGIDMLMVDVDFGDAAYNEIGIWQGMSGSPVYSADGRLIGAVAYGLAWGPSKIAGVTPYEAMGDYVSTPAPEEVRISGRQARAVARATDVSRTAASQGFAQLPMRTGVSGITGNRLRRMKNKGPDYLNVAGMRAAGSASGAAAGPEALEPGGNLGAAFSYGDVTIGGIGTVTSVCEDELVGFGHPFAFSGRTTLGMMPADAVYIQGDPVGPGFKMANMGNPAGTIEQDRLTGISGKLGVLPDEADISSTVTYGTRDRTGVSHSLNEDYNADVAFTQILANHDRVVDAIKGGTSLAGVTISGTDADGDAFAVEYADRYTSRWDISFESIFEVSDLVWALSSMRGVTVDQVTAESDVTDAQGSWKVKGVEQRRGRSWVTLSRRSPAVATAGRALRLRATLKSGAATRRVPVRVAVPRRAGRRGGILEVRGGASLWESPVGSATTPAELAEGLTEATRNDQVQASLRFQKRRRETVVRDTSAAQNRVVRGRKVAGLVVRR